MSHSSKSNHLLKGGHFWYTEPMKYEMINQTLNIEISSLFCKTIQEFFDLYIPSKKYQHLLIQNKWIQIDHQPVSRETMLEGHLLNIELYPEKHYYQKKSKRELDIVYEDELFLIVNKPSGILVHSDGGKEETMCDLVETYFSYRNPEYEVHPLHRLDKETSGLLIFSKSIIFQPLLDKLLAEKKIRRNYLAFVKGKASVNQSFIIDQAIGKDRHDPTRRVIYRNGQKALTKAKSLGFSNRNFSVFRCTLSTGRTHQIRLHLSHIGYPILNDPLYGEESTLTTNMGLVAQEVEFYHPLKEEECKVEATLPNDLAYLFEEIYED